MYKKKFDITKLILSDIVYDQEVKNWICNVSYHEKGNNLLVETPLMSIEKITLINRTTNPKLVMYAKIVHDNEVFTNTITDIENYICSSISENKVFKNKNILKFFQSVKSNDLYKFYIPVYKKEINILVGNQKEDKVYSIKDLKLKDRFKSILFLSHLEFEENIFYLNWNIIQILVE